jgi:hypothetical protein
LLDFSTLYIDLLDHTLHIHNLYSMPPGSERTTEYNTPIPLLRDALEAPGEHLLIGDFNVHHPWWSGIHNPTQHDAADQLIDEVRLANLQLLTPTGITTWSRGVSESTLDLAFGSQRVVARLLSCGVRSDLDFGSDHMPIRIEMATTPQLAPVQRKRNWKEMNLVGIEAGARGLRAEGTLSTPEQIESYTSYLLEFVQELVNQTVPWSKPSRRANPWWTTDIQQLVQTEGNLRREWRRRQIARDPQAEEAETDWREARREKKRAIELGKTRAFREEIYKALQTPEGV